LEIRFFFFQVALWLELTQFKFNCREVECPELEPRPLHIICNIPINWVKLTRYFVEDSYLTRVVVFLIKYHNGYKFTVKCEFRNKNTSVLTRTNLQILEYDQNINKISVSIVLVMMIRESSSSINL